MSRSAKFTLMGAVLAAFALPAPAAEPAHSAAEIASLLQIGWEPLGEALSAAGDEFEKLKAQAPGDARVLYAFALVQLKHRRYQDAARLLDEAIAADPGDLSLRRAQVWLSVLTKKHAAALVQMGAVGKTLADDAAGVDPALRADLAGFLGRMFGYLEGPAVGAIDNDRLTTDRQRVVEGLTTALAAEFEAGRNSVLERHDEFALRHEQAQETAKVEQEEEKGRLTERLDTEQADIEVQREDLSRQADQAKTSLEATLRDIDGKLATLEKSFAQLSVAAAPIRDALDRLDRRIGRLLAAADEAENPAEAFRLRAEADRLSDLYSLQEREYTRLDAEARQVRGQQDALAGQRRASEERYQDEINRLDKRAAALRKTEKRIAQDRRKIAQPSTGATPKVRSLAAQATAFTTYDEFPLEQEKERLLKLVD